MFKKIGIWLGAFIALIVVLAVVLPFIIPVDSYRPQIEKAVNEHINGKLELGALRLSLWGQVKIVVDGASVTDSTGHKVLLAKQIYFHIPLTSLLSGSIAVTLKMQQPELYVTRDKKGKFDVLGLMKEQPGGNDKKEDPSMKAAQSSDGMTKSIPGFVIGARFGLEIRQATLLYKDDTTELVSRIEPLDLKIIDLSLSHPVQAELSAKLNTKLGNSLTVDGPLSVTLVAEPKFDSGKFQKLNATFNLDLNDLTISMGTVFEKAKGVKASAEGNFIIEPEVASVESFKVIFHNAVIEMTAAVSGLATMLPKISAKFHSNDIALQPWSTLVPMLKTYELGGSAKLNGEVNGTLSSPLYHAELSFKDITMKAPMIKVAPKISGKVIVDPDKITDFMMALNAPQSDLTVKGNLKSFSKPRFFLKITSSGMDLDQWVDFPKPSKAGSSSTGDAAIANSKVVKDKKKSEEEYDSALEPLRKNPLLSQTDGTMQVELSSLKAYGIKMTAINGALSFKDLTVAMEQLKFGLFGGSVKGGAHADLKPKKPTYRFTMAVAGLGLKDAVESQFPVFKNSLLGTLFFNIDGSGASFNPETAKRGLNAKGNMKVEKAQFTTVDVGNMAIEATTKVVQQAAKTIPGLSNNSIKPPNAMESKYEAVTADFTISGGVFSAPNFVATASSGKGLDLKGATSVNILDYTLKADWQMTDTYNLTRLQDISMEQSGVKVEHIFSDRGNPVAIPVHVGGTLFSPQVAYTGVAEAMAKVAVNNAARAAEAKTKAELGKKAQEQLQKLNAPPQIQKGLEGIGKKLFGK